MRTIKIKGTAKSFPPEEDEEVPISSATHRLSYNLTLQTIRARSAWTRRRSVIIQRRIRAVVFKYNPTGKPQRLQMSWNELNLVKNLPSHPNVGPFNHVVLEDVESRMVRFTTQYVPGRTLDNSKVPVRFE